MPYTLGQNPYGNLTVMVIDTSKNNVVWSSDVAGGTVGAGDYPIIGTRGTSPSPAYVGNTIFFFATVTDPDGDLNTNGVFIDLSTVMGASYNHVQMKASPGGSVFETTGYTALQSWNGATVIINATDLHGRYEIGLLKLSILGQSGGGGNNYGPYNNYSAYLVNGTYPPDANGGESGGLQGSSGTTFYYIREASNPSVITHNFTSGQGVLIELYSNALENLAIANTFQLINPLTGGLLTPPSSTDAFGYGGIYGAFYRYTFNFTAPTQSGMYPFQIFLRDNIGTCININDYIRVNQPSYPQLQTYVLNAATNSLIKTSSFNNTDTLVLKIVTKDTDNSMLGLVTGNLQVNDFTGKYIINKLPAVADAYPSAPAYSAPLSSIYKTSPGAGSASRVPDSSTSGVYTLYVKLLDTYQGIWLPNRNSYTLIMTLFSDTGNPGTAETYYDLSIQFNVTAPVNSADIAVSVGSGSYTWSSSGASWSQNSLAWFQGGAATGEWAENIIASNTYNGPVGLDLTDVNHDGYTDLIVGFQDQTVSVAWYEDMNAAGTEWSTTPYTIAPATDALPGIQNAGGTDRGNANEDSTVYATAGGGFQTGYYSQNEIPAAIATGDFDGLGDTGVVVSYVHPVVYTTATSSAGANYANSFGMYFNRGIYVYWNIMNGATGITSSALNGTLSFLSGSGDYGANGNYNTACVGLAVADLNHDGYPDIVGVYNDGTTRVWLNQYGVLNGNTTYREQNAFGANSLITNLPVVPGAHPWDNPQGQDGRMAQVAVMDMNNDGYLDIVRTSTVGTGTGSGDANVYILYTEPSISSDSQAPFSETYSYGTTNGVNLFTNLVAVDNLYENITETQTTVSDVGLPNGYSTLNAADASPSNPNANSPYFTSGVQGVAKGGLHSQLMDSR